VRFPSPRELSGLEIADAISIEIPPSRGPSFGGDVLLIDHHGTEVADVTLFEDGRPARKAYVLEKGAARAVTDIVVGIVSHTVPITREGARLIEAVAHIDNAQYPSDLESALHHAYRLNISSGEMRRDLFEWVRTGEWSKILAWAETEEKHWQVVQATVTRLVEDARVVTPSLFVLTVLGENPLERAAMRDAMIQLERDSACPIVAALVRNSDG